MLYISASRFKASTIFYLFFQKVSQPAFEALSRLIAHQAFVLLERKDLLEVIAVNEPGFHPVLVGGAGQGDHHFPARRVLARLWECPGLAWTPALWGNRRPGLGNEAVGHGAVFAHLQFHEDLSQPFLFIVPPGC